MIRKLIKIQRVLEMKSTRTENVKGPTDQNDCPFCAKEITIRILTASDYTFAIESTYPVTEGHTLIISKRHVADYFDLNPLERRDAEALLVRVREMLLGKDPAISGFNVGVNCGRSAGQTVMHCHIHLIPRREGDVDDPTGGVRGVIPDRMKYPFDENG